jgi:hypothetical protein
MNVHHFRSTSAASTAGYIFLVGEAPISWCSRKEHVVALSTCEAEYIAAALSSCQEVWLNNLMNELCEVKNSNVVIKVDNTSAINLAKNPVAHGRSKHIEMRFHYLREQVSKGILTLEHCKSELQLADIFTKATQVEVFKRLRDLMGVTSIPIMH